jgi:HD-GYP domain-containing protein (c-di-GMP phosphodiesterase class II)
MSSIHLDFAEHERVTGEAFVRLATAADEFEEYAHPHATRIAKLSDALARLFHLAQHDRASLKIAALAHDLGEAAMERDYIKAARALTEDERLDLARHPVIGEQETARAGADRGAQLLVRWHQEWWNGAGYPDALRREQIPLGARILRVADSYCAMTDARPFRPARTEEEARRHLTLWAGLEFDPHIVRAFLSLEAMPELKSHVKNSLESGVASLESKPGDTPLISDSGLQTSDSRLSYE